MVLILVKVLHGSVFLTFDGSVASSRNVVTSYRLAWTSSVFGLHELEVPQTFVKILELFYKYQNKCIDNVRNMLTPSFKKLA